jgi:hypothetical protein
MPSSTHLRLVYSLLKPAVRCAARFGVPVRAVADLLRLAMYEELSNQGVPLNEIAERMGQTARNARSLRARLNDDFFAAEKQVGLAREIEDLVAERPLPQSALAARLSRVGANELDGAIAALVQQGRLELDAEGRLKLGKKYVVLSSERFHNRIDALNHHLATMYRSVIERLVTDNAETAMIKTVSFSARPAELGAFMKRLEGQIRQEVSTLEEAAEFEGGETRFSLGLCITPMDDG